MNSLKEVIKNIQSKPPAIDLDHPDSKTSTAFDALAKLADELSRESTAAASILEKNWERAWPWIFWWSRAALDTKPVTRIGEEAIGQLLYVAPHLLLCHMRGGKFDPSPNDDNISVRCFASSPEIAALALELWLLGDALDHSNVSSLVRAAAGLITSCFQRMMEASPAKERCYEVLRSPRWDIPTALVVGIIREATEKDIYPDTLSYYLLLTCTLLGLSVNLHIPTTFVEGCIRKRAPRWAAFVLRKLASLGRNVPRKAVTMCILGALRIVETCSKFDCFSAIEALDLGRATHGLSGCYSRLLDLLTAELHHRALAVRVIRSIKKIAGMDLDASTYLKSCGPVLESWIRLCDVANARWTLGKTGVGWYRKAICGHQECPHHHSLKLNHKFKRCGGCLVEIYCSPECQKGAWKVHRRECDAKRQHAANQTQSEPTPLDYAFVHKCVYEDFYNNPEGFQKLIQAPVTKEHSVLLIDYREHSHKLKMELVSFSQAEVLIKENTPGFTPKDLEEAFSGIAFVPWRTYKMITILIRTRSDRVVTLRAEELGIDWRLLAPSMNYVLRFTDHFKLT
ncbi:hypothetical protein V5O48_010283 [Marasmius crinis-equi]|uniref:MYND-type domain-containing protein n=1 Tax=Marasmius crinis-equi TaxID=585013 RepID=A0ABR3F8Q9_9AGAR